MQIDLSNNGLLKAWMDGKVKTIVRWCLLFPNSTFLMMCWQGLYHVCSWSWFLWLLSLLNEFCSCSAAKCYCDRANWSHELARRAREMSLWGDDVQGCVSLQAPPCPLLTFVASLTSAHPLLSTGQDSRCVNNADTLQDLVGHLSTLESVFFFFFISRHEKSHLNDWWVHTVQLCLKHCVEGKNLNHVKMVNSYQRSQCDLRSRLETTLSTPPQPLLLTAIVYKLASRCCGLPEGKWPLLPESNNKAR